MQNSLVDFEALVRQHKDAVYRQMLRVCGSHDDAEDALASALANAYRSLSSLSGEESFRPWIVQIGRRVCGRMKQRSSVRPMLELSALEDEGLQLASPDATPEEIALEESMKTCLYRALDKVPPLYRSAYELRDIEGLSAEEAAARLGISVAALKSRLHRARSLVREEMELALGEAA